MKDHVPRRVEFTSIWSGARGTSTTASPMTPGQPRSRRRRATGEDLFRVTIHGPDGTAVGPRPLDRLLVAGWSRTFPSRCRPRTGCSMPTPSSGTRTPTRRAGHYGRRRGRSQRRGRDRQSSCFSAAAKVTAVVSRFGYMPTDDSPFVNEVFDPDQVDTFFNAPSETRRPYPQPACLDQLFGRRSSTCCRNSTRTGTYDRVAGTAPPRLPAHVAGDRGSRTGPTGARLRFQDAMTGIERQLDRRLRNLRHRVPGAVARSAS